MKTNKRGKPCFQSHGALISDALICFWSDYGCGSPRADKHNGVCFVSLMDFYVVD